MSKRIRYVKDADPNRLRSMRLFNNYQVVLDVETMDYAIFLMGGTGPTSQGHGTSLSNLKIKAKKALEALGVVFDDEKRVKVPTTI